VVYFRSRVCNLTAEQKSILRDLSNVAGFKATSDIPAWMSEVERKELRNFLEEYPVVKHLPRYSYQVGSRLVDFEPYISLPSSPSMAENAFGSILGALANSPVVFKVFDQIGMRSLRKTLYHNPV
jgi:hypothetical protein